MLLPDSSDPTHMFAADGEEDSQVQLTAGATKASGTVVLDSASYRIVSDSSGVVALQPDGAGFASREDTEEAGLGLGLVAYDHDHEPPLTLEPEEEEGAADVTPATPAARRRRGKLRCVVPDVYTSAAADSGLAMHRHPIMKRQS